VIFSTNMHTIGRIHVSFAEFYALNLDSTSSVFISPTVAVISNTLRSTMLEISRIECCLLIKRTCCRFVQTLFRAQHISSAIITGEPVLPAGFARRAKRMHAAAAAAPVKKDDRCSSLRCTIASGAA